MNSLPFIPTVGIFIFLFFVIFLGAIVAWRQSRTIRFLNGREFRLRMAARAGRLGVWDHRIITGRMEWSAGTEILFGLPPDKMVETFDGFIALIDERDRARVEKTIRDSIKNRADHEVEFRIIFPDGSVHWLLKRGQVMMDRSGSPDRVIGIGLDITDQKNFEERIVEAAEQLWRANRELEQFAYVSSHDLQEPLRKITIYSQMLSEKTGNADPLINKYTESISSSAYRMQKLIDDILAYSRLSKNEGSRVAVDLKKTIDAILVDLEISIQETQAQITIGPLPVVVGHPTQLYQLLQNLLRNAIKFHGNDPLRIDIRAEKKGEAWVISIRDNGIGIDPKYSDKIFNVFYRLHPRSKYPGNGIGLALSKRIVEQHGGRIWFESNTGGGVVFFFTLPERMEAVAQQ